MSSEKEPPPEDGEPGEKPSAKNRWNELLSDIDMHGVPRIQMDLHVAKKVVWVVVMLLLLGVAIWQLYTVVAYFTSWPTSTTFQYVYARERDFPAVTLCNLNPIRQSRTTKLEAGSKARTFFDTQKGKTTGNVGPKTKGSGTFSWDDVNFSDKRADYDTAVEFYEMYMELTSAEKNLVSYSMSEMMLDCSFNGRTCSPKNFTSTVHPHFGFCFTFNVPDENGDVATVSASGPIHGLSLTMLVDQADYFPTIAEAAGLKVLVHKQKKFPFPEDEGMLVAPGSDTQIGIREVIILKAKWPYGDCRNFTEAEGKALDAYMEKMTGVNYTSEGCEKTCFQKAIFKNCDCKHPFFAYTGTPYENSKIPDADFCKLNDPDMRTCIAKIEKKMHNGSLSCQKDCPPSCIDYAYPSTVASSTWPAQKKEKDVINMLKSTNPQLKKQLDAEPDDASIRLKMNQEILKVSAFFQDMKYQYVVTASAYTVEEMASDLGGTVELYLGLSIVTLVEVVEFFMDLCFICSQKRKMKKRTAPEKP